MSFTYVDDNTTLDRMAKCLSQTSVVALDTEFVRERTFYPQVGLIQLNADGDVFLLDPLAVDATGVLAELLTDKTITKVLHSASEDLQVFEHYCRALPTPLIDTQIAAAFAGIGASLSYQALVKQTTGNDIDKDQTRSNWVARPLSDEQRRYAAQDVEFLLNVWDALEPGIQSRGYMEWCLDEMRRVVEPDSAYPAPEACFMRVKGAARLPAKGQLLLRELTAWRERMARQVDVPRSYIVRDPALLELVKRPPENKRALTARDAMHPSAVRKYGDALLDAFAAVPKPADHAERLLPRTELSRRDSALVPALQALVRSHSERLDLPVELLARKRDLNDLLMREQLDHAPLVLTGWRRSVIGEALLEAVAA